MSSLKEKPSRWMEGSGPEADIVISSRVRLARNLRGIPFPQLLDRDGEEQVLRLVKEATQGIDWRGTDRLHLLRLEELPLIERQILVEKHLISPELANGDGAEAVLLRDDEAVSVMVNEEDHLRLQCLLPALNLREAWRICSQVDDLLEAKLDVAFAANLGYLTACPTNVGTGCRASVMLHLPGLVLTKQVRRVLAALSQVGVAVRGLFGEGSEAVGNLFQVSNQITLGRSEEEIIDNLTLVSRQVIDQERAAREVLKKEIATQLGDRVWRAWGLLSSARVLTSQEALALLSDLRLGIDLKLLPGLDPRIMNELIVYLQPAYIQRLAGKEMTAGERDVARADLVRQRLTASQA